MQQNSTGQAESGSIKEPPRVSVLITSYNREQFIAEAIESVLNQTFNDFELIIVDDASSDNTFNIATTYAVKDQRILLYRNEENLGQFANRNKAASLASAPLIKYLDSDDILYPHALELFVKAMDMFPIAGIGVECHHLRSQPQLPTVISGAEALIAHYTKGSNVLYIGPSGCIFRKELFTSLGGFQTDIGILSDTLLMLQMAEISNVALVQRDLFYWRVHENQVTIDQMNEYQMMKERYVINSKILMNTNSILSQELREYIWKKIKKIYVRSLVTKFILSGKFSQAISLFTFARISIADLLQAIKFRFRN